MSKPSADNGEPSMEDLRRTNVELMAKLKEAHQNNLALWQAIAGGPEPRCRDCADFNGRCQGNGLPCDPQERALERVKLLRNLPQPAPHPDETVNFNGRLVTWAEIDAAVRKRNAALSRPEPQGEPFMMLSCREAKQCLHNIPGCICDGDPTNG